MKKTSYSVCTVTTLACLLIAQTTFAATFTLARTPYNALAATLKPDTTTGVFSESDPLKPNTQVSGKVWSKNGSTFMIRLPKDDAGYNILLTKETEITLGGKPATAKNIVKGVSVTVTGTLDTATYTLKATTVELGKTVTSAEAPIATESATPETPQKEEVEKPVSSFTTTKIQKSLKQGEKNADVKKLQDKLVKLGFLSKEGATGYYGPLTTKAVKAFQKAHKLEQVGFVGTKTLNELNK